MGIRELDGTDFVDDGMLNAVPEHGSPGKEEDRKEGLRSRFVFGHIKFIMLAGIATERKMELSR